MHSAQALIANNTPNATEPSSDKANSPFVLRINLKKLLTEDEAKSFAEQAEKNGRTIREHFLAITIGKTDESAA